MARLSKMRISGKYTFKLGDDIAYIFVIDGDNYPVTKKEYQNYNVGNYYNFNNNEKNTWLFFNICYNRTQEGRAEDMNLAKLIKTDIDKNGIKQTWLAEQLDITVQTLHNILNGNKVGNKTLRSISKHYNISLKEVVRLNDNQQVQPAWTLNWLS